MTDPATHAALDYLARAIQECRYVPLTRDAPARSADSLDMAKRLFALGYTRVTPQPSAETIIDAQRGLPCTDQSSTPLTMVPPDQRAPSDDDLRRLWKDAGGGFYGPKVETGTMVEAKLLPFLRSMVVTPPPSALVIGVDMGEGKDVTVVLPPAQLARFTHGAHCGTIPATAEQLAAIAQPSATGGWVACKDRQPEVADWYLAHIDCSSSNSPDFDEVLFYGDGRWGRRQHAYLPLTHWQPIAKVVKSGGT